jgi:beta-glucosidase
MEMKNPALTIGLPLLLGAMLVARCPAHAQTISADRLVDSLLSVMTLEEKLGQLNQLSGNGTGIPGERADSVQLAAVRRGMVGSFLNVLGAAESRRVQRVAVEESRLKIPLLFGLDVIHGFRTTFPIPLGEASSWDTALAARTARVAAIEATAAGVHWTFAPMVDIARDPRWGRIAEGAGEDPLLGSAMAAARVRGFQGDRLTDATSLLACAKHFAAYGAAEGGRDYNIVDISERTLREVYLPPFHAAVDAGVATLMASFNEINGIPSSGNRKLLTDILRGEWGFGGFVVSDWTSVQELQAHGVAGSRTEAGLLGIEAGVDMDMMSGIYVNELVEAAKTGRLPVSTIDQAVRRVLRVKFAAGLFDNPYRGCDTVRERTAMLTPAHRALAREAAVRSMVLLKNDGQLLPLSKSPGTIAIIGPLAGQREMLGPWSSEGKGSDVVTILDGITARVSAGTQLLHMAGCSVTGDSALDLQGAAAMARRADVIVLVLGEPDSMSGEAASRSDLTLPGRQADLLRAVAGAAKPVILILKNGRPLVLSDVVAHAGAILEAWYPGIEEGNAVADILFGDASPSGRLPVSFPRAVGQIPVYYRQKSTGRPYLADDHYTSKYLDIPNTPLFPFGYGLTYTTFAYDALTISPQAARPADTVTVSVAVANTGRRQAIETVQLYIHDSVASITRPMKELKGFTQVTLAPGERRRVRFALPVQELGFLNADMRYVVEPGMFRVIVGGSSADGTEANLQVTAQ